MIKYDNVSYNIKVYHMIQYVSYDAILYNLVWYVTIFIIWFNTLFFHGLKCHTFICL